MSPREIDVLPDGLTIERVAPGLFEVTYTDAEGGSADLLDLADLQRFADALAANLTS